MFDRRHGWLLDGDLYATADGGRHWTKAGPPLAGDDNVRGEVAAVAGPRTAWVAVGTSPARGQAWVTLYHTTDGGRSWTRTTMRRDLPGRTGGQIPACLVFAGPEHGWLVTQVPEWGMGGTAPGGLYRTADGGKSWRFVPPAGGDTVRFGWLYFLDATTGFTVEGRQAEADAGVIVPNSARLYRTTDGGLTWRLSPVPLPPARFIAIERPVFFNARAGVLPVTASGGSGSATLYLYATADAGATWRLQGRLAGASACYFLNASDGWVWGNHRLYRTADGGRTFSLIAGGPAGIGQFDFVDPRVGWAVRQTFPGSPDRLYKTEDGGRTWVRQSSP